MKTIEEKIDQIVKGHAECRWLDASELRAYLEQIAAEQRAIDAHEMDFATKRIIDKACEWLKGWFADSKYYTPQEALDSLRKYMEE